MRVLRALGALKGNRGAQQYEVPPGTARAGHTVVIWCRAFSATFGSARLGQTAVRPPSTDHSAPVT